MQHTTIIDAIAANPDAHKPPVFGALLAQRMDEGEGAIFSCGHTLLIGKRGEPAVIEGTLPPDPFNDLVAVLDAAHGCKVNRMGKPTVIGPVSVQLQHYKHKHKLRLTWNGNPSAHERLAFLRSFAPYDTMEMAWR